MLVVRFSTFQATRKTTPEIIALACLIIFFFTSGTSSASDNNLVKKHVLIINSYHKGLSWTDNIVKGVESVLGGEEKHIELYFEYMDTKRYYGEQYFQKLYETYKFKYRNDKFDVIIVSDNDAFDFIRKYRKDFFPGTPVVFCGINDYKDSMLEGQSYMTGVVEETDVRSTIEIILKFHPKVKKIVVINDKTTTGIAMKNEEMMVIPGFQNKVKFVFLEDFDITELLAKVREVHEDSIILLSVFNRDRKGISFSYEESLALIYEKSKVPIYSFWDFYLGRGIVGGMLTSAFHQGKSSAEIALRILQGENISNIPLVKKSPNRYMFDYKELERFGISQAGLPKESIIVNLPDTFYSKYKNFILGSATTIFILSLIISILLVNISSRKKAEKALRESEEKYRNLYDTAPDMYHSVNKDGIIIECNETEAIMLGYKKEEIIGMPITHFYTTESVQLYEKVFKSLKEKKVLRNVERTFVRKDGTTFMVSSNVFVEVDKNGELVRTKTIGRDITEHKRMEEEIMNSREQLRNLSDHLMVAREEERGHIAREIHDELGQVLSKLKLDLSWLKSRLSKDNNLLVEKTEKMSNLIDTTIKSVQKITAELRPVMLDHLGLSATIEWQAEEFGDSTGIECKLNIDEDIVLDQNLSITVFRIFQETLTNIIRHSEATKVEIELKKKDDTLMLEVKDNGKGIKDEQIKTPKSFGLIGMQERARLLGGEVNIYGIPGNGTTVKVSIPVKAAGAEQ